MDKFLNNLRSKSLADRRAFAFFVSALVTGIFFIVWIMTMSVRFDSQSEKSDPDAKESTQNVRESNQ